MNITDTKTTIQKLEQKDVDLMWAYLGYVKEQNFDLAEKTYTQRINVWKQLKELEGKYND